MRRILFTIVLAFCFVITNGQNGTISLQTKGLARQECTNDSFESFNAHFSFETIESTLMNTEKGAFSAITIPNTFPTGADGTPELPAARKLIAVPHGATPRVVVNSYDETEYKLADYGIKALYPHQPSVRKDMKPEDVKFVYNEKAYAAKSYENRPVAQVEVLGTLRDLRIGTLTINPVIYNAATNSIIVRNNIEVEVIFDNADYATTTALHKVSFNRHFAGIYNEMFNRDVYTEHPDLYNNPTHMMVIIPDEWIETLQPWVEWKTKVGIHVDVYPTSVAGTTYNTIQNFIHSKFAEGQAAGETPTYLVLVGDTPQIPATTGSSSQKVTDLYYASVDGDYFPDMYYSRMSVSSEEELANIIEKSLVYEQASASDLSHLGKALLIAGVDGSWNPQVGQPAINFAHENHFTTENGYTDVYKYLNSYSGCYNHLSTGVGLANYTAHGGETSWADPTFSVSNVNSLTNVDKYFLAIGNCCVAANFGYNGVCLAEAMIRAQQKGAYAYIGSCPNTYWYEDYYWGVGATNVYGRTPSPEETTTGVYKAMNWDTSFNVVGSIAFMGNLAICYAHDGNYGTHSSPIYYWQAYHTFGDPSIMHFCGLPTENTVDHLSVFPIGLDFFEVTAAPGSIVSITKDGVIHGTGIIDETGTTEITIDPILNGGDVDIVITCHNKLPYVTSIPAAALECPFVVVEGFTVEGDGILSYGETTGMSIAMKNVGADATVGNTIVTISTEDPLLTINNATAEYEVMNPEDILSQGGFNITVSPEIEDGHLFIINVNTVNGEESWQSTIRVNAYKPILEFGSLSWQGSYEAGETLDLDVTIKNVGGYQVSDVQAVLSSDNPFVTINTAEAAVGEIAADGYAVATFNVTVSDDCEITEVIDFVIDFSGDNGAITAQGEFVINNSCLLQIDLADSYGDGWNGASLVVSFDNGAPAQTYTINSGNSAQYTLEVGTGTNITLSWTAGSYDSECSFSVIYAESGVEILSMSNPIGGVLIEFMMDCSTLCGGVSNFTATSTGNNTIQLSWDPPTIGEAAMYSISRDGEFLAEITETEYLDENLAYGIYNYCVIPTFTDGCIGVSKCLDILCSDDFNIPVSGELEITTCLGMLYDDGGANAGYSANCNSTTVIYPEIEGANMTLTGTYDVENSFDKIYIYDGPDTQSELLGTYTGTGSIELVATNGPLTVKMTSDGSVQKTGFAFAIGCEGGEPISDIPGDANGDFEVNVNDIILTISYLVGSDPEEFIYTNADVNMDNVINILDIQCIVNIILADKYDKCEEPQEATYSIEDGIFYIETPVAISAFQFVFDINESMNLKALDAVEGFNLTSMMLGTDQHVFIGYSLDYKQIPVGKTALFNIHDAELSEVVLSDIAGCLIDAKALMGIDDLNASNNVYPNPFNNSVTIEFNAEPTDVVELVFTNIEGKVVDYVKTNNSTQYVWTPSVDAGLYFVTIKINGITNKVNKLIYQK